VAQQLLAAMGLVLQRHLPRVQQRLRAAAMMLAAQLLLLLRLAALGPMLQRLLPCVQQHLRAPHIVAAHWLRAAMVGAAQLLLAALGPMLRGLCLLQRQRTAVTTQLAGALPVPRAMQPHVPACAAAAARGQAQCSRLTIHQKVLLISPTAGLPSATAAACLPTQLAGP
jgi:hypothetical protein